MGNKQTEQVRGPALRDKMIESEIKGKKFRAEHQGADIVQGTSVTRNEDAFDEEDIDDFQADSDTTINTH